MKESQETWVNHNNIILTTPTFLEHYLRARHCGNCFTFHNPPQTPWNMLLLLRPLCKWGSGPTGVNWLVMQPESGEAGIWTQAPLTPSSAPNTALAGKLVEKIHHVAPKALCGLLRAPCHSASSRHIIFASFPQTLQPPSSHRVFALAVPSAWDALPLLSSLGLLYSPIWSPVEHHFIHPLIQTQLLSASWCQVNISKQNRHDPSPLGAYKLIEETINGQVIIAWETFPDSPDLWQ